MASSLYEYVFEAVRTGIALHESGVETIKRTSAKQYFQSINRCQCHSCDQPLTADVRLQNHANVYEDN